jgi:hypothetical protein
MPKVITGQGLQEFIETGKHETIAAQKKPESKEAPPLEIKKEAPVVDVKPPEEAKPEPKAEDDGLEPEDKDLSEIIRKKIGKKHRAMKEAQEAAADAESFAKAQFDERRLVEDERDKLKRELDEVKKASLPKAPELKQPTKDDAKYVVNGQFDWDTYTNDVADYKVKKAFAEEKEKREQEALKAAQERIAAENAEAAKKFKENADKIDGFREKLATSQVWFPDAVLEYITLRDDGPELTMYLVDNPETADRISKLRPIKAIAEIDKITKSLGKKAKAVESAAPPAPADRGGAPPPITPISGMGTGTVNTDPSKMSTRELRAYEAERWRHKQSRR